MLENSNQNIKVKIWKQQENRSDQLSSLQSQLLGGVGREGKEHSGKFGDTKLDQGGTKRCSAVATLHENLSFGRKS